MMKRHLSLVILGVLCSLSAFAGKYGTAGCGLGSIVFNDKPGMIQILATTTNSIYGNQTFAISSGTSNCTESHGDSASLYIEANEESLRKDIARGQGETLTGLSQIYSCDNAALLGTKLQQNYNSIYSAETSANDVSKSIQNTIRQDSELSGSCRVSG